MVRRRLDWEVQKLVDIGMLHDRDELIDPVDHALWICHSYADHFVRVRIVKHAQNVLKQNSEMLLLLQAPGECVFSGEP